VPIWFSTYRARLCRRRRVCSGDAEVEVETSVQVEVGAGGSAGGVDEGGRLVPATGWRARGGPRARCSGAASGRVAPVKMDVGSWDMEMWNRRGEVRAKKRTVVYIGREWDSSTMTLGTVRVEAAAETAQGARTRARAAREKQRLLRLLRLPS
jgi:hypothetical protein